MRCLDGRPFGHNRHGQKSGGCCAPFCEWTGSNLTQCRLDQGLPLYEVASWSIQPFGHNVVVVAYAFKSHNWSAKQRHHWPQYTNVTDKQGQTNRQLDNGPIAQGEPFYKRSPKNWAKSSASWWSLQCHNSIVCHWTRRWIQNIVFDAWQVQYQNNSHLPSQRALPLLLDQYSFTISPRIGGWVSLGAWLNTKAVYLQIVPHLSTNQAWHRLTLSVLLYK